MAQWEVTSAELNKYTFSMIKYAVHYRTKDVVNLLRANGIQVPANVDSTTLHAMVLTAMINSKPFKEGLVELLQSIARENVANTAQSYSSVDGTWANQTGCDVSTPSPTSLDALLGIGVDTAANVLLKNNTNANIKNAVAQPPSTISTMETVLVTGLVIAASALVVWLIVKKKKNKIEIIRAK